MTKNNLNTFTCLVSSCYLQDMLHRFAIPFGNRLKNYGYRDWNGPSTLNLLTDSRDVSIPIFLNLEPVVKWHRINSSDSELQNRETRFLNHDPYQSRSLRYYWNTKFVSQIHFIAMIPGQLPAGQLQIQRNVINSVVQAPLRHCNNQFPLLGISSRSFSAFFHCGAMEFNCI